MSDLTYAGLDGRVGIWQGKSDNLSGHFLKEENMSQGAFVINCGLTYDFVLVNTPASVYINPGNADWADAVFWVALVAGVLGILVSLFALGVGSLAVLWRGRGRRR
jgi:hypothetical protein